MKLQYFVSIIILAGCAHTSGVVPTSDTRYKLHRIEKGFVTGLQVKADALADANTFCAGLNKKLEVVSSFQEDMVLFTADAHAEIEFLCR